MRRYAPGKKTLLWTLVLAGVVGAAGLWQRDRILSWYYVHQLAQADEAKREVWVARIVGLGEPCVQPLIRRLRSDTPQACANVEAALTALGQDWGAQDARTHHIVEDLAQEFAAFGPPGKAASLAIVCAIMRSAPPGEAAPATIAKCSADLLAQAANETQHHLAALRLACAFLERVPPGQGTALCRGLAFKGLAAEESATRLAAAKVLLLPGFREDGEALAALAPLLKAETPELRRAALMAVAKERTLVGDDDLLLLLHDPDLEVRHLCELALRSRGLPDSHIFLGRLISNPDPGARLRVVEHLQIAADLDPGVWLERLTQDPVPAVRAAAVRAVATSKVDLLQRLGEMAREDPSPTVRQLAAFYMSRGPSHSDD